MAQLQGTVAKPVASRRQTAVAQERIGLVRIEVLRSVVLVVKTVVRSHPETSPALQLLHLVGEVVCAIDREVLHEGDREEDRSQCER